MPSDDDDDDANDPLGPARPLLTTAMRLGGKVEAARDPVGAYELYACAARLARKVKGLGEVADFRLERALEDAEAEDKPAEQAEALRAGLDTLLGDEDEDETGDDAPAVPEEPLAAAQSFIEMAISIGAPAYNTGDRQGCFDVYAATARMILASITGADDAKAKLKEALDACDKLEDANEQAWALRHAFDAVGEMGPGGANLTPREVRLYLSLAVQIGAPAFNTGDRRGCYEVYACTARLMVNTASVPDAVKLPLRAALEAASVIPDVGRQAMLLRHAFDTLLKGTTEATGPDDDEDQADAPDDTPEPPVA